MGTCMDLLTWVEPDMVAKILTRLDDPSDLVRVGAVSLSWRHFVVENGLFKQLCLRMFPQLSRVSGVIELNQNKTEDRLEVGSSSSEWESMVREHRVYAFVARCSTSDDDENCILEAISASTTDSYPRESIVNTLEPREVVVQRPSYWSSSGQRSNTVPETLIYKLVSNFCVITEIRIRPFQAFFQPGMPIYSARAVRFRVGHAKFPSELESSNMEEHDDDKFIWTYTSQVFQMDQLNRLQKFKLPEPVLSIGGYLQIELLGRVQTQEMDGWYYICVSYVEVVGHSLAPALDAEIVDLSSGKFVLKRDLKVDDSPENVPKKRPLASDSMMRRITLDQIAGFMYGLHGGLDEEFVL